MQLACLAPEQSSFFGTPDIFFLGVKSGESNCSPANFLVALENIDLRNFFDGGRLSLVWNPKATPKVAKRNRLYRLARSVAFLV